MQSLTLTEIQSAIAAGVRGRGSSPYLVARALFCSESTLYRTLRRHGTSFTVERNRVRVEVATELLKSGRPAALVAARVGVTPDYLRRLIVAEAGVTPVQLAQAARLGNDLAQLPRSFAELAHRRHAERWLDALVGDLPAPHPLAGWAKELLQLSYRPELETEEFFTDLRRRHQEERASRRDEGDLRRLEQWPDTVELVRPRTPDEDEEEAWMERSRRADRLAGWRRRLKDQRRLMRG